MIISISGSIASGKTTLAKNLAKALKMKHISVGNIMRDMAKSRRMSLMEFSKLAENDQDIDKEIDEKQKELAIGNCIVDGRLSAYLLKPDFSLWLTAPLKVRAQRLAKREGISEEEAAESIKQREESERKRYKQIYNVDLDDMGIYDIVIDTGDKTADKVMEEAFNAVRNKLF